MHIVRTKQLWFNDHASNVDVNVVYRLAVGKICGGKICPGIEQAELTGQRLAELNLPYTVIVHSTMARARETANLIHNRLRNIQMAESDLLREGAPYPPEPPLRRWRPDYKVFDNALCFHCRCQLLSKWSILLG